MSDRVLNVSGLFKLFYPGSERNTLECWLYIKLTIIFAPNLEFFPSSGVIYSTWKYNIQVNESITKIKEKWSIIQFDAFDLSCIFFYSNVPDNKCHRQKWCVLFFTCFKLVVRMLACVHAIARIMRRRLLLMPITKKIFKNFIKIFSCS